MRPSYCPCCENYANDDDPDHNNTNEHRFNFLLWQWNTYRKAMVKNRHGLEIEVIPENANRLTYHTDNRKGTLSIKIKPESLMAQENMITFLCTVKNIRSTSVLLISANSLHPYEYFVLYEPEENVSRGRIVRLCPGAIYRFKVIFCSGNENNVGQYEMPFAFNFQTDGNFPDSFTIARSIAKVKLLQQSQILELEVPGLAEKRPSVMNGDMIHIHIQDDDKFFIGSISRVNDKTVEIAYLDPSLLQEIRSNPEIKIDVRFRMGRLPLERMHQGVDQVVNHRKNSYLFPTIDFRQRYLPPQVHLNTYDIYNHEVAVNLEQKTAVLNILNESSGLAPYIVFGPPGTGKTITIVEAILQLKNKNANHRILVSAPANAACDMLTEKLIPHCTRNELLRITAETVDRSTIQPHVMEYTNYDLDGNFRKIPPNELQKYNIVVSTLILIGRYAGKYKPTIVFIDEAAQASEPEVDSAIGMLEGTQIILAGDHKQLGPNTSSRISEEYGLGKSLLERLWGLELYQSGDERFITMLKKNFRSHSTILSIPNRLFYENQLQACSVQSENDPIANIFVYKYIVGSTKKIRNGQAIEFCNIISKERRYGRSPSYFNEKEVEVVLQYVKALIALDSSGICRVTQEDIGIVTPYIRQVSKVKEYLRQNNFSNIEVGTTETFQGREKRIIIITTVRAQANLLLFDRKYNIGFVRNEKRFNVAITRAKSKLIIIGCAHVLYLDSKWRAFIDKCIELNVFCGAKFAQRTIQTKEEILQRFRNVRFIDSQHNN